MIGIGPVVLETETVNTVVKAIAMGIAQHLAKSGKDNHFKVV